jgi:hypothetical protein
VAAVAVLVKQVALDKELTLLQVAVAQEWLIL